VSRKDANRIARGGRPGAAGLNRVSRDDLNTNTHPAASGVHGTKQVSSFAVASTSGVIAPYVLDGFRKAVTKIGYGIVDYTPMLLQTFYPDRVHDFLDKRAVLGANLNHWSVKNKVIAILGYGANLFLKTDDFPHHLLPCALAGIPGITLWYDDPHPLLYKYGKDAPISWNRSLWRQTCFDGEYIRQLNGDGFDNLHYLPLATDPDIFHQLDSGLYSEQINEHESDAVFVGSFTQLRADVLSSIIKRIPGLALAIYGDKQWKTDSRVAGYHRGSVDYGEPLNVVYAASKIVINLDTPQLLTSVNNRIFDALAGGNLIITEDKPDVHRHFKEGEDLLVYRGVDDLAEQLRQVLHEPDRFAILPVNGRRKVLENHTWDNRLRELLKQVAPHFGWKIRAGGSSEARGTQGETSQ
jgi:glycosyltransferase involved in cell wall biosynthesis